MKIQYASDLHLEFRQNTDFIMNNPLVVKGSILVLAGDTILLGKRKFLNHPFFDWCSENYECTYLIPGNHEYYEGYDVDDTIDGYDLAIRHNVRMVNNRSFVHNDVELFFTTLWSPVSPLEIVPVQMGMTDCYRIKYKGKPFNAHDYAHLHHRCFQWLSEALATSKSANKVVVSHHCPTRSIADPRFESSTINSAFCTDLDSFINGSSVKYWIYGHTHYNLGVPKVIGNTVLLSNQLGYVKYGENTTFKNDRCIEI